MSWLSDEKKTVQIEHHNPEIPMTLCNSLRYFSLKVLFDALMLKAPMHRSVLLTILQSERARNALNEAIADIR